jgi:dTDP-4-amino-4,6-dideoxygalactose transaminase
MIPFLDLKAQYLSIKSEIDAAVASVFQTSRFVLGDDVTAFEDEFAAYCQTRHGIGVNSGTSALHLSLLAAGVGPGDEVITVPFTFVATIAAIAYTGATPVFVDIEPNSLTIDVKQIEKAITPRTRVIVPVHLYGQAADMDSVMHVARHHSCLVIEDAAQAHGAEYKGRRAGSIGDFGCFSFYPTKNLGACGEAGIVLTNNTEYAHTIRLLRDWGQERKHCHVVQGFNYRMDSIQAAVLRTKLRYLDGWVDSRRVNAGIYSNRLANSRLQLPPMIPDCKHAYHIYAVRAAERDVLRHRLYQNDIETCVHYPIPVHLQKAFAGLGYHYGDFPRAEQAARDVLSLPVYPEIGTDQIEEICLTIRHTVNNTVQVGRQAMALSV